MHRTLDLLQLLVVPEEQQRVEVAVADVSDDGARQTLLLQVALRLVDEVGESGYGNAGMASSVDERFECTRSTSDRGWAMSSGERCEWGERS